MIIKNFYTFCESISGTELVGHVGPNYGDQKLPITLTSKDTALIYSEIDDKFYNQEDYQQLYNNYLKNGGSPLFGFNIDNINIILSSQNS